VAKRLSIGSALDVTLTENGAPVPARVEQLLPVASEELQSTYSVPFPFAEQGSIYAVARIEAKDVSSAATAAGSNLCAPGKVVTATLKS
jgi:hypothetical protein